HFLYTQTRLHVENEPDRLLSRVGGRMIGMGVTPGFDRGAVAVARDVADQIGAIDALRELTLDVIAALDLNAAYIRSGWRINFGPDEETALDQLWHRRAFHQHLEDVAEAAPIPTTRG